MRFLCRHLLSERGEASQTALTQEIINTYKKRNPLRDSVFLRGEAGLGARKLQSQISFPLGGAELFILREAHLNWELNPRKATEAICDSALEAQMTGQDRGGEIHAPLD